MFRAGRWRYLHSAKVLIRLPTYARLVWGLLRDGRTPVGLKALLGAALAYVAMPVDLIPDLMPVIGTADDLTVLLLVLDLFISNAPADLKAEHLARAGAGQAVLDQDLARLRNVLGDKYDRIRDSLPEILERYAGLKDPDAVKRQIVEWRAARAKPVEPVRTSVEVE